jgi:hypothetical protein
VLLRRRASPIGTQQLDRHLAVELGIVGGIDHAHAALSHTVEDQIPADGRTPCERAGAVSTWLRQRVPVEEERLRAGIYGEIPVCRTIGWFFHRITQMIPDRLGRTVPGGERTSRTEGETGRKGS